jgi:hypothetical protein
MVTRGYTTVYSLNAEEARDLGVEAGVDGLFRVPI